MARTSAVAPPAEGTPGGATILPGVPLPMWGRAEEPVLPDPPPPPAPAPVAAPLAVVDVPVAPVAPADLTAAPPVAPAPVPFLAPVEDRSAGPVPAPDDPYASPLSPDDGLAEALAAPVPALDPPAPAAPVAAAYAAAGAAPPTAPWGTPPAPVPVPPLEPAPTSEPVDLAPPSDDPVPAGGAHRSPEPVDDGPSDPSRRRLVLLGALGGVVVLGAVAAFGWPGFLVAQDDSAGSAPAPAAAPVSAPVTLRAPQTVAGLSLLRGAVADSLGASASATAVSGYTAPVSAVYGRGTTPAATVVAWTATSRGTPADVSTAFAGYQGVTGRAVTAITPVPPGAPGGRMSCGSSVVGSTPASVCFWSDDATFGAITVLRPVDAAQAAALATAIRSAVETRG